ncbi:hypothetical protein CRV01_08830 [Arcobacter sp. CECT 8983]|uniref:imelysin family protein n=1 Tax=Arcobacter sp. CECT 8983 TaxID=2044508 RepID=UPI00100B293C|nr:imelysin family protein [Arcobacter sp. CECT 8983]RXJ88721.1 hypothetical protein CRV01_08830 [Arcobacter sp. CECT 8983]
MKILKIVLTILCLVTISNAAVDKNKKALNNIYEQVILKDSQKVLEDIKALEKEITNKNIENAKKEFKNLVTSWKSVQSVYILGDLNEDYIDTPRLIDIYHHGNEDIKIQLDRAIKSNDEPRIALFKNSLKSINALEYVLYKKDIKNKRVNELTLTIVKRIKSYLEDINNEYKALHKTFLSDLKKANGILINRLIQNTYKLKEWRVGDILGTSKKYKDNFDNKRGEYFISKNSSLAIAAILNTYKNIFNSENYYDYGDYLKDLTHNKQVDVLRDSITKAISLNDKIKDDDFKDAKELYEVTNTIHVVLFLDLIEELSINAKIIDADGD